MNIASQSDIRKIFVVGERIHSLFSSCNITVEEVYRVPQTIQSINFLIQTLSPLIKEYLYVSLFKACAESITAENASRLAAMQRAEKNIEELLSELQRSYYRIRQQTIDEELFDIITGFNAMNDSQ